MNVGIELQNPIMEESQILGGLNETSEGPGEIAILGKHR